MKVTINDKDYEVFFDLADITLGQWLEYYHKYGKQLQLDYGAIAKKDYGALLKKDTSHIVSPDEIEEASAVDLHEVEEREALAWFSFWTGYDLTNLENEEWKADLVSSFHVMRAGLSDVGSLILDLTAPIEFAGEKWCVQNHDIKPEVEYWMVFKPTEWVVKKLNHLKQGKWNALPFLVAVYFRKIDEPFDNEFVRPGSERMTLLQSLPMHIAQSIALMLMDVREPEGAGEFVASLEN